MADNVDITPGSGATIGADLVSSVLYQRTKVVWGADGTVNDASAATPLPVQGGGVTISQTPTITAGAYSAKDGIGGLLTFAAAARSTAGHGKVNTLIIKDKAFVANVLQLWLFDSDPTVVADNGVFTFTDANLAKCVGVIPIAAADYYQAADNQIVAIRNVGLEYHCAATSLFGALQCTGTPTYASTSDLTITLEIEYLD